MKLRHCIVDLELIRDNIDAMRARAVERIQELGPDGDPVQLARLEGVLMACLDIGTHEVGPCLRAWRDRHAFSRQAEDMLEAASEVRALAAEALAAEMRA